MNIASSVAQDAQEVKLTDIYVMKTGDNSKGINIGDSPSKLEALLGAPNRVYDYYLQMDEKNARVFQYGLNLFYFLDGKLATYDLYDGQVSVGTIGGTSYKVGDMLTVKTTRHKLGGGSTYHTTVTKSFLNFKLNTTPGKTRNIPYGTVIQAWINRSDAIFEIVFDKGDKIVNICADSL